jgi:DNA-binding CsgD family transcriptional regulator
MLLANCAIWSGDVNIWYEAKKHICEAPSKTEQERDILSLAIAVVDSSIFNNRDFPDWFTSGNFEALPADSHPAAKVYYVKYLSMSAFAIASGMESMQGVDGVSLMGLLPRAIEPLITQAVVDGTIISEIYLRLSCASAYYNSGDVDKAIYHIDRAIALSLPDGLYGILAEHCRHFGGMLEEKVALVDEEAADRVRELNAVYSRSWARLSGAVRNRAIAYDLTDREREIAKLVAFGYTNKEIAQIKYISESTVKQTILRIVQKTGVKDKSEFSNIL